MKHGILLGFLALFPTPAYVLCAPMKERKTRLGMINFINGRVPDYKLASPQWIKLYDHPANLNRCLRTGQLDISPVSSMEYLLSPEKYLVLPGLCIGARDWADTVGIFSKEHPRNWKKGRVFLTGASLTSIYLFRVLVHKYWNVEVETFQQKREDSFQESLKELGEEFDGVLLIGDRVVEARKEFTDLEYFDLAREWNDYTGFSFVFALWLVRREFAMQNPGAVRSFHKSQLESVHEGLANLEEIFQGTNSPYDYSEFTDYFTKFLSYDLDEQAVQGFLKFAADLTELGLIENNPGLNYFEAETHRMVLGASGCS